jgi:uncharacterized protein HemY
LLRQKNRLSSLSLPSLLLSFVIVVVVVVVIVFIIVVLLHRIHCCCCITRWVSGTRGYALTFGGTAGLLLVRKEWFAVVTKCMIRF